MCLKNVTQKGNVQCISPLMGSTWLQSAQLVTKTIYSGIQGNPELHYYSFTSLMLKLFPLILDIVSKLFCYTAWELYKCWTLSHIPEGSKTAKKCWPCTLGGFLIWNLDVSANAVKTLQNFRECDQPTSKKFCPINVDSVGKNKACIRRFENLMNTIFKRKHRI